LINAGLVDELVIYLAPYLIGDMGLGMLKLPELTDLQGKRALAIEDIRSVGPDLRITAQLTQ
jgi:diaminohydroxyphosphoribosylaminopyrimidine deaminase / 5-amino-6-(5-phosphoribosylamino)uracil reductase